jgi:hypothetical protein
VRTLCLTTVPGDCVLTSRHCSSSALLVGWGAFKQTQAFKAWVWSYAWPFLTPLDLDALRLLAEVTLLALTLYAPMRRE